MKFNGFFFCGICWISAAVVALADNLIVQTSGDRKTMVGDLEFICDTTTINDFEKHFGPSRLAEDGKTRIYDKHGFSAFGRPDGKATDITFYLSRKPIMYNDEKKMPRNLFSGKFKFADIEFDGKSKTVPLATKFAERKLIKIVKSDPGYIGSLNIGSNSWWFYPEWSGGKQFESSGNMGTVILQGNTNGVPSPKRLSLLEEEEKKIQKWKARLKNKGIKPSIDDALDAFVTKKNSA